MNQSRGPTNSERLSAGNYTLFAVPGDGEAASLRVVADHNVMPDAAKARLRIVYASRDAGEFDVFATGRPDAIFDAVDFQAVTDYLGSSHSPDRWSSSQTISRERC